MPSASSAHAAHDKTIISTSKLPLVHMASEWRRNSHGTPIGLGQSASRCITPPAAKPNAAGAHQALPRLMYEPHSSNTQGTPQCVSVRCLIHKRCAPRWPRLRHHATSSQSGAVPPQAPANKATIAHS